MSVDHEVRRYCAYATPTRGQREKSHAESDERLWTLRHLRDLLLHDKRLHLPDGLIHGGHDRQ